MTDRQRIGAWAGMIAPVIFVGVFTIEGWLRPGYDARSMFVSELGLGPRGWVQRVNFIVTGLLMLAFAWGGVAAAFREGKASKAGPILLAIMAVCLVASGFAVMDPPATPRDRMRLSGLLHGLFGALFFSLTPVSCLVFFRRFRADPDWHWLQWWTLLAALIITAAIVVQSVGPTEPPAAPNAWNAWNGVIQRASLVTYMVGLFVFAVGLYRWWQRQGSERGFPS